MSSSQQHIPLQLLLDRFSRIGLGEEYPVQHGILVEPGTTTAGDRSGDNTNSNNNNNNSNNNSNNNNSNSNNNSKKTIIPNTKTKTKKTNPRQQSLRKEGRTASVLVLVSSDAHVLFTLRSRNLRSHPGQVSFPGGRQDPGDNGDDVFTALRETKEEVGLDFTGIWTSPATDTTTTTTTTNTTNTTTTNTEQQQQQQQDGSKNHPKGSTADPEKEHENGFRILCRMPSTEAIGRLCVTPIVALHERKSWRELNQLLHLNRDEVEEAFWVPLSFFFANNNNNNKNNNETKKNLRECYDVPDWPVPGETFVFRRYHGFECPLAGKLFDITGLTAQISHDVASVACGSDEQKSSSSLLSSSSSSSSSTTTTTTLRGYLRRKTVRGSRGRGHWIRCFFVLSSGGGGGNGGILHQYDSPEQALRKEPSATKKNRLRLAANTETDRTGTVVRMVEEVEKEEEEDNDESGGGGGGGRGRAFVVSTLGGRVRWDLRASSPEERSLWVERIESIVN